MTGPRARRDRHGRGLRGPFAPPSVPASSTKAEQFDDIVSSSIERLELRWPDELETIEFAVADIPPRRLLLTAWENREVPLGQSAPGEPGQVVLFRRPIEIRSNDQEELVALVREVVAELVADLLDLDPEDIDPEYG
jgi:predicted Zn-dependent protease with MMP-like domain